MPSKKRSKHESESIDLNKKQKKFLRLYQPVKDNIWRYCLYMTLNRFDAQDLLSDTIEAAYKGYENIGSKDAFLAYMFTTANRIRKRTKQKRSRESELTESVAEQFLTHSDAETKTEFNMLLERIKMMSENETVCLLLSEVEGYPRKDISEITGLKEETVKSILYRAKNKLRRDLEVDNG
jgi:RNA polymerase sigma-70 factor (ECF subfamily)